MSKLILYRGLPGSGKSTAARKASVDYVFEADDYFNMWPYVGAGNGSVGVSYWFSGEHLRDAHKWCLWRTTEALRWGYTVAVANTFTRLSEMQPYLDLGYDTTVYRMTKNYGSVHGVPKDTIDKMIWRFQDYEGEILLN